MTKTAVIVCPGRGTYNKTELGYLNQNHTYGNDCLKIFDKIRQNEGQTPLAALDAAQVYDRDVHTRGDNASALIFAASFLDAQVLHNSFDVVAVTGNSMGWYTALAVSGAVGPEQGFSIVNTMGTLMHEHSIGGQTLYPFVDADWREIPGKRAALLETVQNVSAREGCALYVSIHLGGMLVVAGNEAGLGAFEAEVPARDGRFPMRLFNHAAFHTPLQEPVAAAGCEALPISLFGTPQVPMVDGCGRVWLPGAVRADDLRGYTLGQQVVAPYDFTAAIRVAARVFAPDIFIIPGPGDTLGGAVAQALIEVDWRGLGSKQAFQQRQQTDPVILSMGRSDDRAKALTGMF